MKLLSTVALAAAAGAARAAAHDAHIRHLVLSLRETATHATERRGLQGGPDILTPCLDALGIPEAVYECFLGDLDSETGDSDSTATEEQSDAFSNLVQNPAGATTETCQEAFQPRSAQCTVFIARMDNATDVLDQIASTISSNFSSNFTALPAQCQLLVENFEPVEEGSTQESTEDSLAGVSSEIAVTALTAAGDACEALVPGVTTSKLNAEPTSAPTISSDTGDDDDDDSTNEPTRAPTPSSGDDDDDDSTKEPTRAPTPASGDDDDDDEVTTTATPTTSPTAASSASTDRIAVAAGVLAALLVR